MNVDALDTPRRMLDKWRTYIEGLQSASVYPRDKAYVLIWNGTILNCHLDIAEIYRNILSPLSGQRQVCWFYKVILTGLHKDIGVDAGWSSCWHHPTVITAVRDTTHGMNIWTPFTYSVIHGILILRLMLSRSRELLTCLGIFTSI